MKEHFPFCLKTLPYSYDAMTPYISERTMTVHHSRLLSNYVKELNSAIKESEGYKELSLSEIYSKASKNSDKSSIKMQFLSSAVYNHYLFFAILAPTEDSCLRSPIGTLRDAIRAKYRTIENFMLTFRDRALDLKGSGWIFLCKNKSNEPDIIICPNHSMPSPDLYRPIAVLDMWEHSYYCDYFNKKKDYCENFFRLINWKLIELLYSEAIIYS